MKLLIRIETWIKSNQFKLQVIFCLVLFFGFLKLSVHAETPVISDGRAKIDITYTEPIQQPVIKKVSKLPLKQVKPRTANFTHISRANNAPVGWYPAGQCTHYIWARRPVGKWNNASQWLWQAKRDGYTISDKPRAGAIGWQANHVVYIERVSGNQILITEANYDYNGSIRTVWRPANNYKYIY